MAAKRSRTTVNVTFSRAVWEQTTFTVYVPSGKDPVEYVKENIDALFNDGEPTDEEEADDDYNGRDVDHGDLVDGVAKKFLIYTDDNEGKTLYDSCLPADKPPA